MNAQALQFLPPGFASPGRVIASAHMGMYVSPMNFLIEGRPGRRGRTRCPHRPSADDTPWTGRARARGAAIRASEQRGPRAARAVGRAAASRGRTSSGTLLVGRVLLVLTLMRRWLGVKMVCDLFVYRLRLTRGHLAEMLELIASMKSTFYHRRCAPCRTTAARTAGRTVRADRHTSWSAAEMPQLRSRSHGLRLEHFKVIAGRARNRRAPRMPCSH
ncbi:hypothetical protein FA95DRAFT_780706 [Auriscalpium vulgare]|uniref:Uncharacterized protein n=1 Tax=Auriscalpium vulgare TaxID=40419 RepID=A0ACB8RAA5_9AGAM|nr:hypothetical protein FA95DRAFT_780706 [Auriscalpium vulgare]